MTGDIERVGDEFTEEMIESAVADLMALKIPSLGARRARQIVRAFEGRHAEALDAGPEGIAKVPGIDSASRKKIADGWERSREERATIAEIQALGVPSAVAAKIRSACGGTDTDHSRTLAKIAENPYAYVSEAGGDFACAERVARKIGTPKDHISRIAGGIAEIARRRESRGDTSVEFVHAISTTAVLLRLDPQIVREKFWDSQTCGLWLAKTDKHGWTHVQRKTTAEAESRIANFVRTRSIMTATGHQNRMAHSYKSASPPTGVTLHERQIEAIHACFETRLTVVTGRAGCGKTLIMREIAGAARAVGAKIQGCAPTGLAAARLSTVASIPASTIHRLLGLSKTGESQRHNRTLENVDVLVIDECSLMGTWLADSLFASIPETTSIIVVGDPEQIGSMEPGAILRDLSLTPLVRHVRLTKVYRSQSPDEGGIVEAAWDVLEGRMPKFGSSVVHVEQPQDERCGKWTARIVERIIAESTSPDDVRAISPMRAGPNGVEQIASDIRDRINASTDGESNAQFRTGDRIIYTENDDQLGIANGDLGYITEAKVDNQYVLAMFSRGRTVRIESGKFEKIAHAMCLTGHQTQGDEFRQVVIPIVEGHAKILDATWLYTSMARAKYRVILVGSKSALENTIARRPRGRETGLSMEFAT